MNRTYDIAVIGAGCFGAWCALELRNAGHSVVLLDAWGPGHSRASSGGESRVIRMGYGPDELYTRWSLHSLGAWHALSDRVGEPLFYRAGMLWLSGEEEGYVRRTQETLMRVGVAHERLGVRDLERRFPQFATADVAWALWEPDSGALMARRAVRRVVAEAVTRGVEYRTAAALPPAAAGSTLARVALRSGEAITAQRFVFACGPWLPKLFPDLLGPKIFPTRQEIFFFAAPPGDASFELPAMPCWFHHPALVYGMPDLDNRGVKISVDRHGCAFDPDAGSRVPSAEGLEAARTHLSRRFPKLAGATLTESRVCQYENTSSGDFVIDRHPQWENVYIAGGGSGHGFKHGPAVGAYVAELIAGSLAPEPRFALGAKQAVQARTVY